MQELALKTGGENIEAKSQLFDVCRTPIFRAFNVYRMCRKSSDVFGIWERAEPLKSYASQTTVGGNDRRFFRNPHLTKARYLLNNRNRDENTLRKRLRDPVFTNRNLSKHIETCYLKLSETFSLRHLLRPVYSRLSRISDDRPTYPGNDHHSPC